MKIKFGFGISAWNWERHQFIIIPTIGVIDRSHYFGCVRFTINISWLLWEAYVEFWESKDYVRQKRTAHRDTGRKEQDDAR